jgi:hypothetical protein
MLWYKVYGYEGQQIPNTILKSYKTDTKKIWMVQTI